MGDKVPCLITYTLTPGLLPDALPGLWLQDLQEYLRVPFPFGRWARTHKCLWWYGRSIFHISVLLPIRWLNELRILLLLNISFPKYGPFLIPPKFRIFCTLLPAGSESYRAINTYLLSQWVFLSRNLNL